MEKIISTAFRMSLVPRWGDYPTNFGDNTANHSYRVACISLLMAKLEKQNGKEIDEEKVLFKALFHDFNEVITGPIKHETKKDETLKYHIKKLEREKSIEILEMLPEEFQEEFFDYIVEAEDNSIEGRVVDAADSLDALLFSLREKISGNVFHFPATYDRLVGLFENTEFESIKYIIKELEKPESDTKKLLMSFLELDRIKRWRGKMNMFSDNDANHSFRVSVILALLSKYEESITGRKNDTVSLIGKALFHDLPEAIAGDPKGPIKHSNKDIKQAFEDYEKNIAKKMCDWFPESVRNEFKPLLVDAKDNTKEGKMVDIGDKVDALLKSLVEITHSNKEYTQSYKVQLENIRKKYGNEKIVQYLLTDILHDMYLKSL